MFQFFGYAPRVNLGPLGSDNRSMISGDPERFANDSVLYHHYLDWQGAITSGRLPHTATVRSLVCSRECAHWDFQTLGRFPLPIVA